MAYRINELFGRFFGHSPAILGPGVVKIAAESRLWSFTTSPSGAIRLLLAQEYLYLHSEYLFFGFSHTQLGGCFSTTSLCFIYLEALT